MAEKMEFKEEAQYNNSLLRLGQNLRDSGSDAFGSELGESVSHDYTFDGEEGDLEKVYDVQVIDPAKGRGLVANCAICTGADIFYGTPDVIILYSNAVRHYCAVCLQKLEYQPHVACSDCRCFSLCVKCNSQDAWDSHALSCYWNRTLNPNNEKKVNQNARFLFNYCSRVQSGDTELEQAFDGMCGNETIMSKESKERYESFCAHIANYYGPLGLCFPKEKLLSILYRLRCNSFEFSPDKDKPIGFAVQKNVSLMNHSCDPNCTLQITETGSIVIKALRNIQKGEELTLCYYRNNNLRKRRAVLLQEYSFLCRCPRCLRDEAEERNRKQ